MSGRTEPSGRAASARWLSLLSVMASLVATATLVIQTVAADLGWLLLAVVSGFAITVLIGLLTELASHLMSGPANVARLRSRVEKAFLDAIDASPLNPNKPQEANRG